MILNPNLRWDFLFCDLDHIFLKLSHWKMLIKQSVKIMLIWQNYVIFFTICRKKEEVAGLKSNMEQLKTAANPNQAKIDNATKSYETAKNELVSIWKGTAGSVSVGNEIRGITRQITGVAAGTTYRGQSAVAVGVRYTPKPNMVISLSGSADTNNGVGATTGVSFGF